MLLPGRALFVALVVLAVTSATLYVAVARVRQRGEQEARHLEREHARADLDSGLEFLLAANADERLGNGRVAIPRALEAVLRGVELARYEWGVYDLLSAWTVTSTGDTLRKQLFAGARREVQPVLTLLDRGNAIKLSDYASVNGDVALPGRRFEPRRLVDPRPSAHLGDGHVGAVAPAPRRFPTSNTARLAGYLRTSIPAELLTSLSEAADTVVEGASVIVHAGAPKRRVAYVATEEIVVPAGSTLQSCLLIAPRIRIGAAVQGSVQAFATDTLALGRGSRLDHGSALVLGSEAGALLLDADTHVEGAVVHLGPDLTRLQVALDPTASVDGLLYVVGVAGLHGTVRGKAYVGQLGYGPEMPKLVNTLDYTQLDTLPPRTLLPLALRSDVGVHQGYRFR